MHLVSNDKASLILFDYSSREPFNYKNLFGADKIFNPIALNKIENLLTSTGLKLKRTIDITQYFKKWYTEVISNLIAQKSNLLNQVESKVFYSILEEFSTLISYLNTGRLGGVIIYANSI